MWGIGRWVIFWAVITVSVVFVAYVAVNGTRATAPSLSTTEIETSTTAAFPTQSTEVALFIGDSYTAGTGSAAAKETFAGRSCSRLDWVCYFDAEVSTGYLAGGGSPKGDFGAFPNRLKADRIYAPDVVVVSSGRSDLGLGPVTDVASTYFKAIRKQFPKAKLIVLEPFWTNAMPSADVVALQQQVKQAAIGAGARWIPTDGWLADDLVGSDGVTPTPAGHQAMASKLSNALS